MVSKAVGAPDIARSFATAESKDK